MAKKWLPISYPGVLWSIAVLVFISSCRHKSLDANYDEKRPRRSQLEYFDKKFLLYQLPADYYRNIHLNQSFDNPKSADISEFEPLGYDTRLNLEYEHVYSSKCVFHTADTIWKYAEVCFPNKCLTKGLISATARIKNPGTYSQTYAIRLFCQNTSYWYRTDDSIDLKHPNYLDNFYGSSDLFKVTLSAGQDTLLKIPYRIDMDSKFEMKDESKIPVRAGNYEFLVLALPVRNDVLINDSLDLIRVNPFAVVKEDELLNGGKKYGGSYAYTGAHHFKFVFLNEYFDGTNDLTPNHIYVPKNGKEKPLCDTCSGWYRAIISEFWRSDDFFSGFISKGYFVKSDYGIKRENCVIDTSGITLIIPKSRRGDYKKTWGEVLFGPSFKYGHLTIRAKFAQMMNKTGTPNGIIHNLWLYERDPDEIDTANPYNYLRNSAGKQPYEIDFEIWNSEEGVNTPWDNESFINYSIVDYMRNPDVIVKPGEVKDIGNYRVNRLNNRQLNVPGSGIPRDFFNSFHTYELYWFPDHVQFLVDGIERAYINSSEAKIPDKHLFLWIGSPLYQDGTYYSQSSIPFLKEDKKTIIDYIRID